MQKYKIVVIVFFIIWGVWISTRFFIKIELNGPTTIYLEPGEVYEEYGANASFFGTRLSVKIAGTVNNRESREYKIYYSSRNMLGLVKKKTRKVIVKDRNKPVINLKGSPMVILKEGENYKESGYTAKDLEDGNLTNKVKISGKIYPTKLGNQVLTYEVCDKSGNCTKSYRKINVVKKQLSYLSEYDKVDNQVRGWGHGNKKDHKRPIADARPEDLVKYNAYYMGPDEPVIYLTFDEGSNDTYVKEILEVLKEKHVKATFFLCRHFIVDNPNLIRQMVKDGHIVGNHTHNHKQMPTLANKEKFRDFKKELLDVADAYKKITGQKMPLIYREPAGTWSYRSLKIASDMGYRTYFWSAAYVDFEEDLSKEDAYKKMMSLYHNGAIYLLHPKNKGNYLALGDFIDQMRELGYRFDTVDHIA